MTIIKKHRIVEIANLGNSTIFDRYKNAVKNTKKFNLGLIYSKRTKVANGEKTEFFRKDTDVLTHEWYFLKNRVVEFGYISYKESLC